MVEAIYRQIYIPDVVNINHKMDNTLLILNALAKEPWRIVTMHQLAQQLKIPYTSFHRTIKELDNLIQIEEIGRAKTLKLNTRHPVIAAHLAIASYEERKEFEEPLIQQLEKYLPACIVLLFGSYARNEARPNSDIDLLLISTKPTTMSSTSFELLHKKKVNYISVTIEEFQEMLREKEMNVGKQALENHIILKNPLDFWKVTLDVTL